MTAQATDRLDDQAPPAHGGPDDPDNAQTAPTTDRPARDDVIRVADTLIDLLRSFNRTRARMLAAAAHDVEWSAHILLKCASLEGPIRASALAEAVQSDPSTVS